MWVVLVRWAAGQTSTCSAALTAIMSCPRISGWHLYPQLLRRTTRKLSWHLVRAIIKGTIGPTCRSVHRSKGKGKLILLQRFFSSPGQGIWRAFRLSHLKCGPRAGQLGAGPIAEAICSSSPCSLTCTSANQHRGHGHSSVHAGSGELMHQGVKGPMCAGLALLGPVIEKFVDVADIYEPLEDGTRDKAFISKVLFLSWCFICPLGLAQANFGIGGGGKIMLLGMSRSLLRD